MFGANPNLVTQAAMFIFLLAYLSSRLFMECSFSKSEEFQAWSNMAWFTTSPLPISQTNHLPKYAQKHSISTIFLHISMHFMKIPQDSACPYWQSKGRPTQPTYLVVSEIPAPALGRTSLTMPFTLDTIYMWLPSRVSSTFHISSCLQNVPDCTRTCRR